MKHRAEGAARLTGGGGGGRHRKPSLRQRVLDWLDRYR